jgi:glutamine transport system permease protein
VEKFFEFLPVFLKYLWPGIIVTLEVTAISYFLSLVLGFIISQFRIRKKGVLFVFSSIYIDIFRRIPLVVQILTWYYISVFANIRIDIFFIGILAIALNKSAYLAEAFRGVIQAIPKGQWEAGKAIGMSNFMIIRRIILPQALRILLPELVNYLIMNLLDSSLVSIIAVNDLTRLGRNLISRYFRVDIWIVVAIIYFILSYPLSKIGEFIEKKWKLER